MQALLIMASAVGLMATSASHPPHWSYQGHEGPEHWGALSPEFATCGTGHTQSPIDHGTFDAKHAVTVSTDYHAGPLTLLNNGHTVQANFVTGSTLSSGGHSYGLVQVHFHTPSEEAFNGEHYPMVAHFVHKDTAGKLAVLGVLFEEGAPNVELAKLIAHAPKSETPSARCGATCVSSAAAERARSNSANRRYARTMPAPARNLSEVSPADCLTDS